LKSTGPPRINRSGNERHALEKKDLLLQRREEKPGRGFGRVSQAFAEDKRKNKTLRIGGEEEKERQIRGEGEGGVAANYRIK